MNLHINSEHAIKQSNQYATMNPYILISKIAGREDVFG
jgi:hypothetical protein